MRAAHAASDGRAPPGGMSWNPPTGAVVVGTAVLVVLVLVVLVLVVGRPVVVVARSVVVGAAVFGVMLVDVADVELVLVVGALRQCGWPGRGQ